MVVTSYLFFGFLIACTHGVNPNENHNLEQSDQNDQDRTMYEHPSFTYYKKMEETYIKPVGHTILFNCKAHGIPTPNITWYKNNKTPKRNLGTIRYGTWYLGMEDLITDDSGIYTCVVCNIVGCISHNSTLDVVEQYHYRPIITDLPQNKTVVVGSNVSFTCTILSDLSPYIYWVAGISPENSTTAENKVTSQNPEILEFYNVTYESEGWYTCVAANSLGVTFASAYLKVVDTFKDFVTSIDASACVRVGTPDFVFLLLSCLILLSN